MFGLKKTQKPDTEYYQLAEQWDTDIIRKSKVSRNRAYVFGIACLAVAGAACIAVASLAPLKRVEVVTVLWDQTTGVVRQVKYSDDAAKFTSDEAVIKNHIQQFMVARETWDMAADNEYRRRVVKLFLSPNLVQDYNEEFNPVNRSSRVALFGSQVKRRVVVRGINFLNKKTAIVQWESQDERTVEKGPWVTWSSIVGFSFTAPPTNEEDVYLNPIGFQVTSYRRDQIVADPGK